MKKAVSILLTVILLLSLTACGDSLEAAEVIEVNTAQDSETYVFGEDFQQNWNSWGSMLGKSCTASENGYYFYNTYSRGLLYFHDFETDMTVPVCGLPNCTHDSTDCDANLSDLGLSIKYIYYYDGNLYVIGTKTGISQDVCVYRISPDGATRGKVGTLFTLSQNGTFKCAVHRGYVYGVVGEGDSQNKNEVNVYRLSLSGGEESEIICTFDPAYGAYAQLRAYGNDLYICHTYFSDEGGSDTLGDIYTYQIHTGELDLVLQTEGNPFVIDDKHIYYTTSSQVLAYDRETKETTLVLDQGPMFLAIDGNYLYCDNEFYIYFLPQADGVNNYEMREIHILDINTFDSVKKISLTLPYSFWVGACGCDMLAEYNLKFYDYDLSSALAGQTVEWELME